MSPDPAGGSRWAIDWVTLIRYVSRSFGFTFDQVVALTLPQAALYAEGYEPPRRTAVVSTAVAGRLRAEHADRRRQWVDAWLTRTALDQAPTPSAEPTSGRDFL